MYDVDEYSDHQHVVIRISLHAHHFRVEANDHAILVDVDCSVKRFLCDSAPDYVCPVDVQSVQNWLSVESEIWIDSVDYASVEVNGVDVVAIAKSNGYGNAANDLDMRVTEICFDDISNSLWMVIGTNGRVTVAMGPVNELCLRFYPVFVG